MQKFIYKIDENGGAHDFDQVAHDYEPPAHVGDPEKDIYTGEGELNDEVVFQLHEKRFRPHLAKIMMRRFRDSRLWDSDYMAYTDYPHTFTQAWKDHRQALRDVPQNNPSPDLDDNGDLINVVWPETPDYPGNSGPM